MKRHFDDEIKDLNVKIIEMAALTEKAISGSIEALKKIDKEKAITIIKADSKIDNLELEIEEMAISLLALRQPLAVDLRFITTAIKINNDIERIADIVVNICQRVLDLPDAPLLKQLTDIPHLADVAEKMIKDSIDSFVKRDEQIAKSVIMMDPVANELRNKICTELMENYLKKDSSTAPYAVPLLLVARHLERICDHTTYIAEDVIYMTQAKVVRHHRNSLD